MQLFEDRCWNLVSFIGPPFLSCLSLFHQPQCNIRRKSVAKQKHVCGAGAWTWGRSTASPALHPTLSPSSLHGKEPRASSQAKTINFLISQSTNSHLSNKAWSPVWNQSLRKNQALQEQMGFWHPTASTQRFGDDAAWLVLEQKLHRNTFTQNTKPKQLPYITQAEGGYPPSPIFGVEINFLTSVLRSCHYADSPGSIFCSKWLQ